LVVSKEVGDFTRKNRGIPEDKIYQLPNGLPLAAFETPSVEKIKEFRDKLGVPAGIPVICAIGRLQFEKDLPVLLQAASRLKKKGKDLRLFIVGDGPDRGKLESLAADLGLTEDCFFAGHQSQTQMFVAAMDLMVNSSAYEAFPNAVLEAMALKKPVIATEKLREMIRHEENGLLVPVGDAEALANALGRVLEDEALRTRLSYKSYETAQEFSMLRHVDLLKSIYGIVYLRCRKTAEFFAYAAAESSRRRRPPPAFDIRYAPESEERTA
jgi:glycosyltransferase involved in cell wall biosynthesis